MLNAGVDSALQFMYQQILSPFPLQFSRHEVCVLSQRFENVHNVYEKQAR